MQISKKASGSIDGSHRIQKRVGEKLDISRDLKIIKFGTSRTILNWCSHLKTPLFQ